MTTTERAWFGRLRRPGVLTWVAILNAELLLVLLYYATQSAYPTSVVHLAFPWVWVNASIWAVSRVDLSLSSRRDVAIAAVVGIGYFLLLGYFGGLYKLGGAGLGARVAMLPPAWGPAPLYSGTMVTVSLLPFKVVGFLALSYLVAATVVDAAASGLAGFVGLFSCVSCTWPLLATVVTGVFGSASAAAAFATGQPYVASTVVFVASVGLLVWRPVR